MTLIARLLLLVLVAIVPGTVLLVAQIGADSHRREEALRDEALRQALYVAKDLDHMIEGARQFAAALAQLPAIRTGDVAACRDILARLFTQTPQYAWVDAIGADGQSRCGETDGQAINVADRTWFKLAQDSSGFAVGEFVVGRLTRTRSIHVGYRFQNMAGEFGGVVGVALSLDSLSRYLSRSPLPPHGSLLVTDRAGTVLVRVPDQPELVGKKLPPDQMFRVTADRPGTVDQIGVLDGITRITGYVPVALMAGRGLMVSVGIEKEATLAEIRGNALTSAAVVGLSLAASLAGALFIGYGFIRRPIARLLEVAARLETGDMEVRARLGAGSSEFARLGNAIDRMAVALRDRDHDLREAVHAAQDANNAKSRFLANMSHELRTPLNAIMGFSEVIRDGLFGPPPPDRYQDYASDIHTSGEHLLRIINDILDLAKIEVGRIDLHDETTDLRGILKSCLDLVRGPAQAGQVALRTRLPEGPVIIVADPLRLKQALLNLLSNAVKFTHEGGSVTTTIARLPDGGIEIAVRDTGIGMKPDQIAQAFEPFRQIDSTIARRHGGTGLGLPLAQRLAELHGGTLVLDSSPGLGTIACLRLPASRVPAPAATVF